MRLYIESTSVRYDLIYTYMVMIALGQTDIFRTGTNPQTELQMTLGNHQGYCGSSRSNRGVSDMSGSHCDNVSGRSLPVKSIQSSTDVIQ